VSGAEVEIALLRQKIALLEGEIKDLKAREAAREKQDQSRMRAFAMAAGGVALSLAAYIWQNTLGGHLK
jgi:hypothetical protein